MVCFEKKGVAGGLKGALLAANRSNVFFGNWTKPQEFPQKRIVKTMGSQKRTCNVCRFQFWGFGGQILTTIWNTKMFFYQNTTNLFVRDVGIVQREKSDTFRKVSEFKYQAKVKSILIGNIGRFVLGKVFRLEEGKTGDQQDTTNTTLSVEPRNQNASKGMPKKGVSVTGSTLTPCDTLNWWANSVLNL